MAQNRTIPYGYKIENGKLTIDPEEKHIVVRIYERYANGESYLQIAERLTALGVQYTPEKTRWNKNMVARVTDYKNSQNNINIDSTINDLEETLYSEPDQNDEYDDDLVRQLIDTIKVVGDDKLIFTFKCGLVFEQPIQLQVRRLKKSA